MLIRAYRIRGHLIANLDPLSIQKKRNILNSSQKLMVLQVKTLKKIFLDGVLGLQYADLNQILMILKKHIALLLDEFMHMGDPNEKAWIRDRIEAQKKI